MGQYASAQKEKEESATAARGASAAASLYDGAEFPAQPGEAAAAKNVQPASAKHDHQCPLWFGSEGSEAIPLRDRTGQRDENASGQTLKREEPRNLQAEPPYPGLHTACMSIRFPEWTSHRRSKRCPIEEPHKVEDCGEFQPRKTHGNRGTSRAGSTEPSFHLPEDGLALPA